MAAENGQVDLFGGAATATTPSRASPTGGRYLRAMSGTQDAGDEGEFELKEPLPAHAISLRTALQAVFKSRRDATVKEAVLAVVMLGLFLYIIHIVNNVPSQFETHDAVVDLLFDEEFPTVDQYKKNFYEIMTPSETWEWLKGPFLAGVWPEESYSGQPLGPVLSRYMLDTYRRVGSVQFRVVRVTNSSCIGSRATHLTVTRENPYAGNAVEAMGRFDTLDGTCWAEFVPHDEDRSTHQRQNLRYEWQELNEPLRGLFGQGVGWYGTGGYVQTLGPTRENASKTLQAMFEDEWFDRGTRAISLDWTLYNTETRLATSVHVVIEHDESAHILAWYRVQSCLVIAYSSTSDIIRAVAEGLFVVLWLWQVRKVVFEAWTQGLGLYLLSWAHVFDVVLVLMQLMYMVTWLAYLLSVNAAGFTVEATGFVHLFGIAELFTQTATFAGVVGLMMTLRLFVFLGLSKRMLTVWLTIQRALPDMLAFLVGAIVLILGFAIMGYFMFGFVIRDFHNFISAVTSLLRMALGDFDYAVLARSRPQLAPIFFAVFVCVVYLLALTVFIGILTRYFQATHEELKVVDRWKETTPTLEGEVCACILASRTIVWLRCRFCICSDVPAAEGAPKVQDEDGASGDKHGGGGRAASAGDRESSALAASGSGAPERKSSLEPIVLHRSSSPSPSAGGGGGGFEQAVKAEIAAAKHKLLQLRRQTAFFFAATRCAALAKLNNGIDLQQYFERTYELEPNSDRLYVTRDALAVIIGKRFPNPGPNTTTVHGVHIRKQDYAAADAMVGCFHRCKSVELVGAALEMETAELRAISLVRPFSAGGDEASRLLWLRERLKGSQHAQQDNVNAGKAVVSPLAAASAAGGSSASAAGHSNDDDTSSASASGRDTKTAAGDMAPAAAAASGPQLTQEEADTLGRRSARVAQIDQVGGEVDRVLAIDNGHLGLWAAFCADSLWQAGKGKEVVRGDDGKVRSIGHRRPTPPPMAAAPCSQDAQLLILDLQARPVRSLPLRLLVLTEEYRGDPRYAELVFASKDVAVAEEKARGGFNLNVRVRFESAEQRSVFMRELLQCAGAATMDSDSDDDDDSDAEGEDIAAVPVSEGDAALLDTAAAPGAAAASGVTPGQHRWSRAVAGAKKQKRGSVMTVALQNMSRRIHRQDKTHSIAPLAAAAILEAEGDDWGTGQGEETGDNTGLSESAMALAASAAAKYSPRTSSRIKQNPLLMLRRNDG